MKTLFPLTFLSDSRSLLLLGMLPLQAAGSAPYGWIDTDGLRGFDDEPRSSILWDRDGPGGADPVLVMGGRFSVAGETLASRVALYNGSNWEALGEGNVGETLCFTIMPNGDLVAGGQFARAGDGVTVNGVARWNGTEWQAFGTGFASNSYIEALAVLPNGDLVACGGNLLVNGVYVDGIARWDGTAWHPFGIGLENFGVGYDMEVLPNGDLIVTGSFTSVDGVAANYIAGWNGTAWYSLENGLGGTGRELDLLPNGQLVVAGSFTSVSGVSAGNVAIWDGTGWTGVGGPVYGGYPNDVIWDIVALDEDAIYVCGGFSTLRGAPGNYIAFWDGTEWRNVGKGFDNFAFTMQRLPNGDLMTGGRFLFADDIHTSHIARWNGHQWNFYGAGFGGTRTGSILNDNIYDFATLPDGRVVAGGAFLSAGRVEAHGVAVYNGTTWSALGDGLDNDVYAVAVLPNGNILAGGTFKKAGGLDATGMAIWNGVTWAPYGEPIDGVSNAWIRSILVHSSGAVIVGGQFYENDGGGQAYNVARWDGTVWNALADGLNGAVHALLELEDGTIIAGGEFARSGSETRSRIAHWDGTAWQDMGGGMNGTVYDLAIMPNKDVLAVGRFSTSGGVVTRGTALWDGASWTPLASGILTLQSTGIRATLVRPNGDVIVGGDFAVTGTSPLQTNFAIWNGTSWDSLGTGTATGLSDGVYALEPFVDGGFLVGGAFLTMNGRVDAYFARWGVLPLSVVLQPSPAYPGWTAHFRASETQIYCIEYSSDIENWLPILLNQSGNVDFTETDPSRLALEQIFYRARDD